MLDDIKALTRSDRTRLIPMKPELMSLEDINTKIDEIERVTEDPTIMTMGSALEVAGMTVSKWSSLQQTCKRRELEYELERIEYIKQRFENRIFESALKNQTNATMAIFALKNHYGWSDKQNVEIQATQTTKVDVSDMDEELKRQLAERYLTGSVLNEDR
jgi:cellulose biosynthesis protein BcsQ